MEKIFGTLRICLLAAAGATLLTVSPLNAQRVSDLDRVVRTVAEAAFSGKPMSTVEGFLMKEKDLEELQRVARTAPARETRFCEKFHVPERVARSREKIKRSIARMKKRWEKIQAAVADVGIKPRFTLIREFRVVSDCGVRFYRLKLEGSFKKDGAVGTLKMSRMRLIYFSGRFRVVRMFRLSLNPRKGRDLKIQPKKSVPKTEPKPEKRRGKKAVIG